MVRQRNRRIHSVGKYRFFGSFDAQCMIQEFLDTDLFSKEPNNPFSDSFGLNNPGLDFLKETHPKFTSLC